MNNSNIRFVAYSALLTAGVACMLVGLRWLFFLGLGLVFFSSWFSSYRVSRWKPIFGLVGCLAYAAWVLVQSCQDGTVFARQPPGIMFSVLFIAAWVLLLALEWSHSRGTRQDTNHA
jgi:hypothetical protein